MVCYQCGLPGIVSYLIHLHLHVEHTLLPVPASQLSLLTLLLSDLPGSKQEGRLVFVRDVVIIDNGILA